MQMTTEASPEDFYSFDVTGKVMPWLLGKYKQVRKHLAANYAKTAPKSTGPALIKQEQKGAIKSEQVKTETQ